MANKRYYSFSAEFFTTISFTPLTCIRGHGWVGVTQILWNCTAKKVVVQSPYVSGKNYCIGLKGDKYAGRCKDRPDGVWEGQKKPGLQPQSLYITQSTERLKTTGR